MLCEPSPGINAVNPFKDGEEVVSFPTSPTLFCNRGRNNQWFLKPILAAKTT
jgi:hypothetical protein